MESSFNKEDWEDMNREDILQNMKSALDKIDAFEKTKDLLEKTEKGRIKLLNENQDLKKELGKLFAVKSLMNSAETYGYLDLIEKDVPAHESEPNEEEGK